MILSCHDSVSRLSLFPHVKSVFICVHPWLIPFSVAVFSSAFIAPLRLKSFCLHLFVSSPSPRPPHIPDQSRISVFGFLSSFVVFSNPSCKKLQPEQRP